MFLFSIALTILCYMFPYLFTGCICSCCGCCNCVCHDLPLYLRSICCLFAMKFAPMLRQLILGRCQKAALRTLLIHLVLFSFALLQQKKLIFANGIINLLVDAKQDTLIYLMNGGNAALGCSHNNGLLNSGNSLLGNHSCLCCLLRRCSLR